MPAHLGEVARAEVDLGAERRGTQRGHGKLRNSWPR